MFLLDNFAHMLTSWQILIKQIFKKKKRFSYSGETLSLHYQNDTKGLNGINHYFPLSFILGSISYLCLHLLRKPLVF